MDDHSDTNSTINVENNETENSTNLKGFSTAFKTVHSRKASQITKLLKNRKKTKDNTQAVNTQVKKQAKLLKKHRESIRQNPSEYDINKENMLKNIAKKGVMSILKKIYKTQSF